MAGFRENRVYNFGHSCVHLSQLYFSRLSLAMPAKLNFFKTPASVRLISSRAVSTSTGISGCFQPVQAKVVLGPTPLSITSPPPLRRSDLLLQTETNRRPSSAVDSLIMEDQRRRLSEAGVNRRPSAAHVLTEDTDSFIIGQKVFVDGVKPGRIQFIGTSLYIVQLYNPLECWGYTRGKP